jgi:dipeptidyl aminopeptidase/acylaminoacyl peptidase
MMMHPTQSTPEVAYYIYDRKHFILLNKSLQKDFDFLKTVDSGELDVYWRTLNDKKWFVLYARDNGSYRHYEYDRGAKNVKCLFSLPGRREDLTLSHTNSAIVESGDGLNLTVYYTLQAWTDKDNNGLHGKHLPRVLLVHGGPQSRDTRGFRPTHQFMANRGYAVLSINHRGSTGFGKNFINASNLQWGAKMQDDLLDAVNWTVEKGIADPSKLAVMGGGYATLAAMTFTPIDLRLRRRCLRAF